MPKIKDTLIDHLTTKEALIGIVGLGYVGLPLMLRYNQIGYRVLGIDIDQTKVDKLNNGKSYIEHIGSDKIANAKKSGFEATTDFSRITEVDAVILCVPTPLTMHREPDMSYVVAATDELEGSNQMQQEFTYTEDIEQDEAHLVLSKNTHRYTIEEENRLASVG